jgi:hypothetical protein
MRGTIMATTKTRTDAKTEAQIASTVAGHKMAGFDVTEADREMLRAQTRGEITVEQVVAEIKAANAAR